MSTNLRSLCEPNSNDHKTKNMALSLLKFFRPWKNNYEADLCFLVGKKKYFLVDTDIERWLGNPISKTFAEFPSPE